RDRSTGNLRPGSGSRGAPSAECRLRPSVRCSSCFWAARFRGGFWLTGWLRSFRAQAVTQATGLAVGQGAGLAAVGLAAVGLAAVGLAGFEPATPGTQSQCASKLRYSP